MEVPHNPEELPEPPLWSCEACGSDWHVSDCNTSLFIFPTAKEFTFAQFDCEDEECGNSSKFFLDVESTDMLAKYTTNIYPQYNVPDWVVEGWAELHKNDGVIEVPDETTVQSLEEAWSYFWKDYDPWPYEFGTPRNEG